MRATNDLDLKRWASLKRPPCEDVLRGAVRPVRLKPGLDVLVTGDGDETELAAADLAGHGGTGDLGDGAVHDRRELVEDDGVGGQGQGASQVATESLAGAEDVVGPEPGGRRGDADTGQGRPDVLDAEGGTEALPAADPPPPLAPHRLTSPPP